MLPFWPPFDLFLAYLGKTLIIVPCGLHLFLTEKGESLVRFTSETSSHLTTFFYTYTFFQHLSSNLFFYPFFRSPVHGFFQVLRPRGTKRLLLSLCLLSSWSYPPFLTSQPFGSRSSSIAVSKDLGGYWVEDLEWISWKRTSSIYLLTDTLLFPFLGCLAFQESVVGPVSTLISFIATSRPCLPVAKSVQRRPHLCSIYSLRPELQSSLYLPSKAVRISSEIKTDRRLVVTNCSLFGACSLRIVRIILSFF